MFLLYLLAGFVIVCGLHFAFKYFATISTSKAKTALRWLFIVAAFAIILLLLRIGLPTIAAIFSAFVAITAIISRLMVWLPIVRLFQQRKHNPPTASSNLGMTTDTARKTLDVSPTATEADIKQAYHRLMQKLHPDQGGNDYLASQLNEAKEVLLRNLRETK